jgi:hypothetical protein
VEKKARRTAKIHLIASDEPEPRARLVPGKRYEVTVAPIVDNDLRAVADEAEAAPAARPARLCGGRTTCVAIVEIE